MATNLIQNGTFDSADNWTWEYTAGALPYVGGGWVYDAANERATRIGSNENNRLYQTVPVIASENYRVEFDLLQHVGNFNLKFGYAETRTVIKSFSDADVGHVSFDFTSIYSDPTMGFWVVLISSPGYNVILDNVSIVAVDYGRQGVNRLERTCKLGRRGMLS